MRPQFRLTSQLVLLLETLSNNAELCKIVRKLGMSPLLVCAKCEVPGTCCQVTGARGQVLGVRIPDPEAGARKE